MSFAPVSSSVDAITLPKALDTPPGRVEHTNTRQFLPLFVSHLDALPRPLTKL